MFAAKLRHLVNAQVSHARHSAPQNAKSAGKPAPFTHFAPFKGTKSNIVFRSQHLTTTIHAAFQVNVMRTVQFTRIRIFDICRPLQGICRTPHAALGAADFTFWNSHFCLARIFPEQKIFLFQRVKQRKEPQTGSHIKFRRGLYKVPARASRPVLRKAI